ncbi:MAG: PDZ domain-containing protein [Fidelibacterota bacterium]
MVNIIRRTVPLWLLSYTLVVAPAPVEAQEDIEDEIQSALQEVQAELEDVSIQINVKSGAKPKLGLYLDDLDFEEVYEKHYPENYGVLVTGVVSGGNAARAGIIKGDIIMEFDGEMVRFEDHLLSLRDSKSYGDTVKVKLFRNEKIIETDLVFVPPSDVTDEYGAPLDEDTIVNRKKLKVGYGGGGPQITLVNLDLGGLNDFLILNGFNEIKQNELIMAGGYGMGMIGHGWFIGGAGAGYINTQQYPTRDSLNVPNGFKTAKVELGFGGVTMTKKVPLFTERLVLDFSTLIGGGSMSIAVGKTDGAYSWDNKIETSNSNFEKFRKDFFVFQPTVGLLVRIQNWVGIHGSVGYLGMYSTNDKWIENEYEFTVEGDSPSLKDALSYNLGIWFGF